MKKPTTIRLPESTRKELEAIVKKSRRDFSSIVNEMLEESLRMRRFPGIVFADGPGGRRARIAGSGLDVFEVIGVHRSNPKSLKKNFPHLSELQLRSALAYYEAYPQEIDERLQLESQRTRETVHARYPFMKPPCDSI